METITFGRRAGRAAAEWALSHTTVDRPSRSSATPSASSRRCSTARRRAPVAIRDELGRRCTRTSASSAARTRCSARGRSSQELRERYENVVVEDKGEIFNSDLTQAIELGYLLDLAAAW